MRVLMIGSLGGQLFTATQIAMKNGAKVAHVDDIAAALHALRGGHGADLVIADYALDLASLRDGLATERIATPFVACGVDASPNEAAAAIKAGAREFIPLPPDADLIAAVLAAVCDDDRALVSADPAMQAVIQLANQVAPSDAPILITGESGVGKEIMARHVHAHSKRANAKFIAVNCAAIPENLLESELFGHEKGAFTGAVARRIGKFEEADGGTLLLDEITEMDLRLQAKLLRAIQEREIDRVGGSAPVKVNIRILATSNRNLAETVSEGRFREDLFFRLNVVNLAVPPLRARPADIAALAEHFARKYAEANAVAYRPIAPDAMADLAQRSWRGNVRELENTIHRAVILAQGDVIDISALSAPSAPVANATGATAGPIARAAAAADQAARTLVGRTVAEVEQDLILDTLDHCLGNRTHAATILGISIRTLRNKLRAYMDAGVSVPAPGETRERQAG